LKKLAINYNDFAQLSGSKVRVEQMSSEIEDILFNSIQADRVIRIIYNGGSQPGSHREIKPLTVTSTDTRALDITTGFVKTFKLEKIQLLDASASPPVYDPTLLPQTEHAKTIEQAFINRVALLEQMGWHVELLEDSISLFSYFKNGKPKRGAEVLLSYYEFSSESYFEPESGEMIESKKKSIRPFRVSSKNFPMARTFSRLEKAIELFNAEAKILAPINSL
jgi:hypothetical protein